MANWTGLITVLCAVTAAGGTIYTGIVSHDTQLAVETLRTHSEEQVAKIKANTEVAIKDAELRSKDNLLRLSGQIEADRERRAQNAGDVGAARVAQAARCNEMKAISNSMSENLPRLKYNSVGTDPALESLAAAGNKFMSYVSRSGAGAFSDSLPKSIESGLEGQRHYYESILNGYNEILRVDCKKQ